MSSESETLRLVAADRSLLDAAIAGQDALADLLGCSVAEGWSVFPEALPRVRAAASGLDSGRWGARFFLVGEPSTLVGWGGFKGSPRDGQVEVGYEIAPGWRNRGLATAALRLMVAEAFDAPDVQAVVAHTPTVPGPSSRVLERVGFVREAEVADDELGRAWRFRRER